MLIKTCNSTVPIQNNNIYIWRKTAHYFCGE